MEKIINNFLYATQSMERIATWKDKHSDSREILYFSEIGRYALHCVGDKSVYSNAYGQKSYGREDLILLDEDDVVGWLDVHAPQLLHALFPLENASNF